MARSLKPLPRTKANAWANWCRTTRATTKAQDATKDKYRGAGWHMNAREFAEWIYAKLQMDYPGEWEQLNPITEHVYVRWEAARVVPDVIVQNMVKQVCAKHLAEVTHRPMGKSAV